MLWFIFGIFIGICWQMFYQYAFKRDFLYWFSSQDIGYDGEFYRCEHGRAYGIRCSKCDDK